MLQLGERLPDRLYWVLVPQWYRLNRYRSPEYVDPPIDPFAVTTVDPDRIVRFTRREYPPWLNAWACFGASRSGDWDVRDAPSVDESYHGTPPELYHSERFSESALHRSLEAHFDRGVPWGETRLVRDVGERVEDDGFDGHLWNGCTTRSDVLDRCERIDRLYESMRERGCLSRRELNAERGYPGSFRQVMENEILVDVARDGALLFVNGRHRLSIAKLLDLDEVPVAVLVRHEQYVERNRWS